jgi:pyrroline-5-carboxylate reductase
MTYELGIIGAGNMAEAIVRGVLKAGVFKPDQLIASDISAARRDLYEKELGIRAVPDNADAARDAKRVLLSVKPQMMPAALASIGQVLPPTALVISIAAGTSAAFIEKNLGRGIAWRVVRTMPNTPMLVGQGMVGIAAGTHATPEDLKDARRIFESAASVVEVSEERIHAVTAISGSGPAYFFYLVEQMIKAGIDLGLEPAQARELAVKTCVGAGQMLAGSTDTPEELRRKVTSPGGTTQAAITHMESANVGPTVIAAIKKADQRSRELGV